MARIANFNAGPAALPTAVLERAQAELLDFAQSGMSIMEHSHRGKVYEAVHHETIALFRELLSLPDDYQVLFLQGGASHQFAMIPMNLAGRAQTADYVNTGHWAERAYEEAKYYCQPRYVASGKQGKLFTRIPAPSEWQLDPSAAYLHITTNNTIEGVQYHTEPPSVKVPVIADMSSDFLWKSFDASKYQFIYAGAQKNIGPSGVVVVIAKKELLNRERNELPVIFRYKTFAENNSLYNTPPTFGIYLIHHVLQWVKESGGLAQVEARNRKKGDLLYGLLDSKPEFFRCPVEKEHRSYMNVVFRLPSEELENLFVKESEKAGLIGLKGHRSVGGLRASLYNAVSVADVETLCTFTEEFSKKHH
jgi:phosphoserine aminotransferase